MIKYSWPCGDMTSGGEDIIPLTRDEALSWCEAHGFVKEAEKHFGDLIADA